VRISDSADSLARLRAGPSVRSAEVAATRQPLPPRPLYGPSGLAFEHLLDEGFARRRLRPVEPEATERASTEISEPND
jgi:hypothetical protein